MKIISRTVYNKGTIDSIESQSIPPGAASRSLGWLTKGDRIELVRGRHLLGTEISGVGRVSGISVGFTSDGTEVLFRSYGKKVLYYNTATEDWVEISSDLLGNGVVTSDDPYGEDVSFSPYSNLAGAQMWVSSPNSSLFKIMVANPGSVKDNYDASKNFKGYIRLNQNAMYLWNRGPSGTGKIKDLTGLYRSYLDKDEVSDYTSVTNESIGSSGSLTYTGTLASLSGKRTAFGVTFTDTSEIFQDNKDGTLTGSLGGTGTINYTTGAYSITFNSAAVGAVTADYYYEDATSNGVADFTKSGTRTAGQGFIIRQDDIGGPLKAVLPYKSSYYCLHESSTWLFTISDDDSTAANTIFRSRVGIPNHRAAVPTGQGIYYIDNADKSQPRVRLLTFDTSSSEVVPVPLSNNIDLTQYRFDKAAGVEFGDYILFACREASSTVNNRILAFNKIWQSWDILPFWASCFAIFNGTLICGDSLSNNAYELFSGFDDDESIIENVWEGCEEYLELPGLKDSKKIVLEGNIAPDQAYRVYVSVDNGKYIEIGKGGATTAWPDGEPVITGQGSYVDRSNRVLVGSKTLGQGEVAGGSNNINDVEAYHYKKQVALNVDRFSKIKIKYVAQAIGYVSVSGQYWWDIRSKSNKIPMKYT